MASTSPTSSLPESEVTNAFQGLAPSPSTCAASSSQLRRQYDVFINHRGPDVKQTLASTLYRILNGMGLRVFLDSEELELGESLPKEIEAAMRSASLHIAIFSKNYVKSPWCLAELSFMIKTGTKIVPVFYHVQPDDVRYAKGVYADAFLQHEEKGRYTLKKLQEWKKALNNVSFNIGHIVNNKDDEERLLKNIAYCVLKETKKLPYVVADHPVGLDEVVKDFELTTLESAKSHVQIVGIWGMGGSGKTTLAKQLYNNIYPSMEKSSLVLDVRDAASKNLLHNKQKKLLDDLGFKDVPIDTIEDGKAILASQLRSVRALVILDDVDHVDQLNALLPAKDSLGSGSLIASGTMIVVTTREFEVLRSWGISSIYKMRPLQPSHAKQLFCWHSFLQSYPTHGFEELVENFLKACNGLPLSLKILGGQLYGDSNKDRWKILLDKISRILPKDISQRLKVSYDALDDEEKEIFLDIACFFIGEKKTLAIAVWDGSGWSGLHSVERFVNKCLVEIDDSDCIRMHDHLRDLGREIANQQSPYRLWFSGKLIKVYNETQIGIRGIMATTGCTSGFEELYRRHYFSKLVGNTSSQYSCTGMFDELTQAEDIVNTKGRKLIVNTSGGYRSFAPSKLGLKILQVRGNYYNKIIGDISEELVWLRWFDIGQNNLGSLGSLKNLRVLELYGKKKSENLLEELWETDSDAPVQLRQLVISECYSFQRFPKSIGCLRNLKKLVLHNSFGNRMGSLPLEFCLLLSLEHLELPSCQELSSLPRNFGYLRNLRHLDLSNSRNLRRLPVSFKELTLLQYLDLEGCSKLTLESDILENMAKLEHLNLSNCERLEELPRHITNQVSLRQLYLHGICCLRELPLNITQLSKLQAMMIGSKLLTSLPTSLGDLSSLTTLTIEKCPKLQCIPDSLGHLNLLEYLGIFDSGLQSLPKSVRQLNNLRRLDIFGCPISQLDFRAAPCTSSLCNLKQISLSQTEVSKIFIPQDCCPGLEILFLEFNKHLTEIKILPSTVKEIRLRDCKMVRSIWGIDGLVDIQFLEIIKCPKLEALPNFAQFSSLRVFKFEGCYRVKKIYGLEHCRALEELKAETRWKEAGIKSLERMERLRIVNFTAISRSAVEGCIESMKKWPDEIIICTRAVPDAGSFANFVFNYLFAIGSNDNQNTSSNTHGTLVCSAVECQSPKTKLALWGDNVAISSTEVERGKWAWIALFLQGSSWHTTKEYRMVVSASALFSGLEGTHRIPVRSGKITMTPLSSIISQRPISMTPSREANKYVVRGETGRLVEAFKFLWQTVTN